MGKHYQPLLWSKQDSNIDFNRDLYGFNFNSLQSLDLMMTPHHIHSPVEPTCILDVIIISFGIFNLEYI